MKAALKAILPRKDYTAHSLRDNAMFSTLLDAGVKNSRPLRDENEGAVLLRVGFVMRDLLTDYSILDFRILKYGQETT